MHEGVKPTKGPFQVEIFRCANGDPSPGVRAINGAAVCWCHGVGDGEDYANAELIAKALNAYTAAPPPGSEGGGA